MGRMDRRTDRANVPIGLEVEARMKYHIYGIGNALVDMEYAVDDTFLAARGIDKGHMTLVDEDRINAIEDALPVDGRRTPGGSAANTVFAVQGFGGRGFYSCRLADDELGHHFLADFAAAGIGTAGLRDGPGSTGRCLTLVTADAERTMTTFLGASAELAAEDVDEAALADTTMLYMEGYLAAADKGCAAAVQAREIAEAAGRQTALSLSDPAMVENCRDGLTTMLGNGVDQLFGNEEEALAWAHTDRLDIALAELRDIAPFVNITLGSRGSLVVAPGLKTSAPPFAVRALDTTGAGDIYAGAVIYARVNDVEPAAAARFGNFAASELVARHGARLPALASYAAVKSRFPK